MSGKTLLLDSRELAKNGKRRLQVFFGNDD